MNDIDEWGLEDFDRFASETDCVRYFGFIVVNTLFRFYTHLDELYISWWIIAT